MSKKTNGPKGPQVIKDLKSEETRFITSTGAVLYLRPIPGTVLEAVEESANAEWRETYGTNPPTPPTYKMEIGEGSDEFMTFAHNEKSILEFPEQSKEWEKWLKDSVLYDAIKSKTQSRIFLLGGVEVREERKGWESDAKALGLRIPKDGVDRKTFYIKQNLPAKGEPKKLIDEILKLTGVPQEVLDKAEERFRAEVGQQERPEAEGATDTA